MTNKLLDTDGFNNMVRGKWGYVVYNRNDIYVGRAIEKYGEYSESEIEFFKNFCKPGAYVMDIGANIGTHTMALSKIVTDAGMVFAFEAQQIVFQALCANMSINSIMNVECYNFAVSDRGGSMRIPRFDYGKEGNFGGVSVSGFSDGFPVVQVAIDDGFTWLPRLDFVKIDVEGMEKKVLQGAVRTIKKHKPLLYIENDKKENYNSLIKSVYELGYTPYWHIPSLFNENNFFKDAENIYENLVSINMLCIPNDSGIGFDESLRAKIDKPHPLDWGIS